FHSHAVIENMIVTVQQVERGILWGVIGGLLVLGLWLWFWRRGRRTARELAPRDAFVQPQLPVAGTDDTGPPVAPDQPAPPTGPAPADDDRPPAPPAG